MYILINRISWSVTSRWQSAPSDLCFAQSRKHLSSDHLLGPSWPDPFLYSLTLTSITIFTHPRTTRCPRIGTPAQHIHRYILLGLSLLQIELCTLKVEFCTFFLKLCTWLCALFKKFCTLKNCVYSTYKIVYFVLKSVYIECTKLKNYVLFFLFEKLCTLNIQNLVHSLMNRVH